MSRVISRPRKTRGYSVKCSGLYLSTVGMFGPLGEFTATYETSEAAMDAANSALGGLFSVESAGIVLVPVLLGLELVELSSGAM